MTSRSLAPLALLLACLSGFGWITWPLHSSSSVPSSQQISGLTPWLVAGLTGWVLIIGWCCWLAAGRTLRPLAPVVALVACSVACVILIHPGASGLEPVYVFPLIAGALLGSSAGFLTGCTAALVTATFAGAGAISLTDPIFTQAYVWGLWGIVGGWLKPLGVGTVRVVGTLVSVPLGVLSGALLNLAGWSGEPLADDGAFVPGMSPAEAVAALSDYVAATSFAYDLTRGITAALAMALIGGPLLRALRGRFDTSGKALSERLIDVAPTGQLIQAAESRTTKLAALWRGGDDEEDM